MFREFILGIIDMAVANNIDVEVSTRNCGNSVVISLYTKDYKIKKELSSDLVSYSKFDLKLFLDDMLELMKRQQKKEDTDGISCK